jgi:hypothetical protein
MNPNFAQRIALSALFLALASCGGRSQQRSSASPASRSGQCYESPRSYSESGDEPSPAAADSSADYDDDSDGDSDACMPRVDASGAPDASSEAEISRLWNQIREERLAAGLSAEPLASESLQMQRLSIADIQADQEHAEPKSQLCINTCKIEASICKNADSICRLAGTLGGNEWAMEKCNSGKASCKEATKKCADCVASESEALPQ